MEKHQQGLEQTKEQRKAAGSLLRESAILSQKGKAIESTCSHLVAQGLLEGPRRREGSADHSRGSCRSLET